MRTETGPRSPWVLIIEPDPEQARVARRVIADLVKARAELARTYEDAIRRLADATPDLILTSAFLSPREETDLVEHLRQLRGAPEIPTLAIPPLSNEFSGGRKRGLSTTFKRLRGKLRGRAANVGATRCSPAAFADEVLLYLDRSREEREWLEDADERAIETAQPALPAATAPITETRAEPAAPTEPAISAQATILAAPAMLAEPGVSAGAAVSAEPPIPAQPICEPAIDTPDVHTAVNVIPAPAPLIAETAAPPSDRISSADLVTSREALPADGAELAGAIAPVPRPEEAPTWTEGLAESRPALEDEETDRTAARALAEAIARLAAEPAAPLETVAAPGPSSAAIAGSPLEPEAAPGVEVTLDLTSHGVDQRTPDTPFVEIVLPSADEQFPTSHEEPASDAESSAAMEAAPVRHDALGVPVEVAVAAVKSPTEVTRAPLAECDALHGVVASAEPAADVAEDLLAVAASEDDQWAVVEIDLSGTTALEVGGAAGNGVGVDDLPDRPRETDPTDSDLWAALDACDVWPALPPELLAVASARQDPLSDDMLGALAAPEATASDELGVDDLPDRPRETDPADSDLWAALGALAVWPALPPDPRVSVPARAPVAASLISPPVASLDAARVDDLSSTVALADSTLWTAIDVNGSEWPRLALFVAPPSWMTAAPLADAPDRAALDLKILELIESNGARTDSTASPPAQASVVSQPAQTPAREVEVVDEWGLYNSETCGWKALLARLETPAATPSGNSRLIGTYEDDPPPRRPRRAIMKRRKTRAHAAPREEKGQTLVAASASMLHVQAPPESSADDRRQAPAPPRPRPLSSWARVATEQDQLRSEPERIDPLTWLLIPYNVAAVRYASGRDVRRIRFARRRMRSAARKQPAGYVHDIRARRADDSTGTSANPVIIISRAKLRELQRAEPAARLAGSGAPVYDARRHEIP